MSATENIPLFWGIWQRLRCFSLEKYFIAILLLTAATLFGCADRETIVYRHHDSTTYKPTRSAFSNPEECQSCHPQHFREWSISMHAYALKDPVFHALDSIGQHNSDNRLNQFCRECHSPIGSFLGETAIGYNPKNVSALAGHGISCDVCHAMTNQTTINNVPFLRLDKVKQGPIVDPIPNSYHSSIYDARFAGSDVCKACHDVTTPNGIRVERTYSEWESSIFPARELPCQSCHMKYTRGPAAVGGPSRERIHDHRFIGVDVPLTDDFPGREETIAEVQYLLDFSVKFEVRANAAAKAGKPFDIEVLIINDKTGHSIPSGTIFERQMWIECEAKDIGTGAILFQTGKTDPNGDVLDHNSEYVQKGALKKDSFLTMFNGTAIRHGKEIPFFWEAEAVENKTIPAFGSRSTRFSFNVPSTATKIGLSAKLLFRALPPYLLRKIGHAELVKKVPVFTMESHYDEIPVQ